MATMDAYKDDRIECTNKAIRVAWYYFPFGTKTIPYASIRSLERFPLSNTRGKWRIWGSGDLKHWLNLDGQRPKKSTGFIVNLGKTVLPVLTPDDPDTFEQVVRQHLPAPSSA
jgi:hypothetical protein